MRHRWPEHQQQIRNVLAQRRNGYRQEFTRRMQLRYREEARLTQTVFHERLRELEQQQRPGHIKAMLRDIEEQRKRLLQPALFTELEREREQQQQSLQELEWELQAIDYLERIKRLVTAEQQRIMEQVLPKRYALATVDVQPLALEYVIRITGNTGKEGLSCQ